MNNKVISAIVILLLVVGGVFLFMDRSSAPSDISNETSNETSEENPAAGTSEETTLPQENTQNQVMEFIVDGKPFSFSPATMKVKKGDTVQITFRNTQGNHDLRIDEFNAATKVLSAGQTETIEFVADKTGSFEYYCSVGTHRAQGMKGTLIVE